MSQWYSTKSLYAVIGQDDTAVEFGTKNGNYVIKDNYSEYILTDQFDIDFTGSMFDNPNVYLNNKLYNSSYKVCIHY